MGTYVLVHGAFRGSWSWRWVREELTARGHAVFAPSLTGMGDRAHLRPSPLGLDVWVQDVVALLDSLDLSDVVLVGHSQGGLVTAAVAERAAARLARLDYLDAPEPLDGERGVDLTPLPAGSEAPPLPPPDTWLSARPLDGSSGLDPQRLAWVNDRIGPTPLGPSLDPVRRSDPAAAGLRRRFAFCAATPPGYPCHTTRDRLDAAGGRYDTLDAPHDAPLSHPRLVAEWLTR